MKSKIDVLKKVLDGLIQRYADRVPEVNFIVNKLIEKNIIKDFKDIENDHIAFRTLGVPHLGVASLEKIFLHLGYTKRDAYFFANKKINAWWYSPPEDCFPRIFISELRIQDFQQPIQDIIYSYTNQVISDPVDNINLDDGVSIDKFLHQSLWRTPTLKDFNALQNVSEYASWVIYNRYYLNHFTISVHNLPEGFNTIEQFNVLLKNIGIALNNANGEIKTSGDKKLIQSATVASMVDATFVDDKEKMVYKKIPGSYVEFAERLPLEPYLLLPKNQLERKHRREGFEVGNADKIFESTYLDQTKRKD